MAAETTEPIKISNDWRSAESVSDLGEAAKFLSRRVSQPWRIHIPLVPDVRLEIISEEKGKKLRVPSTQEVLDFGGFSQAGERQDLALLTAYVDISHKKLYAGGVALVGVSPDLPAFFRLDIKAEHGLGLVAIGSKLEAAQPKVADFIEGVLANDPKPPYSEPHVA